MSEAVDYFIAKLSQQGIPLEVTHWILHHIFESWNWKPNPDLLLSTIDSIDEWIPFVVEATMEFAQFRPSDKDFADALGTGNLVTILDLSKLIACLLRNVQRPEGIRYLDLTSSFAPARATWARLSTLAPNEYNDQFVLKCFATHTIPRSVGKRKGFVRNLRQLTHNLKIAWWPMFYSHDLERALSRRSYRQEYLENNCAQGVAEGDVLRISKSEGWDQFEHYMLVSEVDGMVIKSVEFKPNGLGPLQADLGGLTSFFLRDPLSKIDSIWRAPN